MAKFKVGDRVVFKHWVPPFQHIAGTVVGMRGEYEMRVQADYSSEFYIYTLNSDDTETWHEAVYNSPLYQALL
jgi:hypothetical protein